MTIDYTFPYHRIVSWPWVAGMFPRELQHYLPAACTGRIVVSFDPNKMVAHGPTGSIIESKGFIIFNPT
jgi:hypothetical protein